MNDSQTGLIGIPDDQGVHNVGGRPGAKDGPAHFRLVLKGIQGRSPAVDSLVDLGDVEGIGNDVAKNHHLAQELIGRAHDTYKRTIIVGGGHDHGYSHLVGVSAAMGRKSIPQIACINIDPHLDVRKPDPTIMSGSPFYLAIESGLLQSRNFIEFGIQRDRNRPPLWDFVERHQLQVVHFEETQENPIFHFRASLSRLISTGWPIVISFDLDSVSKEECPGVSAPAEVGFRAEQIVEMIRIAGNVPQVVSLGIFELNPAFDVNDKTAKVAVAAASAFLM